MIECVPNFSDGRRPEVIAALAAAIQAVAGVRLLDVSSDVDHNRTVITFVGAEADAVGEAAFAAVRAAQRLINLEEQRGAHPRIGATDVLPFVPLGTTTLGECVALAHAVGRRVGDELGLPVYLYEAAATRPERRNLADVRRGEYEGLRDSIANDPACAPDYGPARLGPAGAIAVGARPPLIAFNVFLSTTDVGVAQRIAKAVRHSNGGLRFVKALGLLVGGRAQVSLNLTDYRRTPLASVMALIRAEAMRYGVLVTETEVVGLIPEDALLAVAEAALQLHDFDRGLVLERRLREHNG